MTLVIALVEMGILTTAERVELIEGQLYAMAAKGTAHSAAITGINRVLSQLCRWTIAGFSQCYSWGRAKNRGKPWSFLTIGLKPI